MILLRGPTGARGKARRATAARGKAGEGDEKEKRRNKFFAGENG